MIRFQWEMMMSGTISSNIDALTFDRKKINTLLDQSSKYYTSAYAHLTDMEDKVKKKHAELYLHFIIICRELE